MTLKIVVLESADYNHRIDMMVRDMNEYLFQKHQIRREDLVKIQMTENGNIMVVLDEKEKGLGDT